MTDGGPVGARDGAGLAAAGGTDLRAGAERARGVDAAVGSGPAPGAGDDPGAGAGLAGRPDAAAGGGGAVWLVRAEWVLTCGPLGPVRNGAVAVAGGRIVAVGPADDLRLRYPDAPVVGNGTGILSPGLVCCHGHFSEGLVTGIGEVHTLWEWFARVAEPIEAHLTREMAYVGTLLKSVELALSGVTTVADMFCAAPRPEPATPGVVEALDRVGLRGDVSFGPSDVTEPRPVRAQLAEHDALRQAAAASRRTRFRVGLGTVPTSSDELLAATVDLARDVGRVHVHVHEVREEVTASRVRRGTTPVRHAERIGLLDAEVVAAHCVWLDDDDVAVLRRRDVAVAHCPVSNMILASGVCPVPRLRREGVTVGLGVDGPASNDGQNMLETVKVAALLQKVHHLQATALTAPEVLDMATAGGARALGLAGEIGSLEVGKSADLALFDGPALAAIHDPYQALVYTASVREVAQVWVAGEPVVAGGRVVGVQLDELLPHARELAVALARSAGLDSQLARDPSPLRR